MSRPFRQGGGLEMYAKAEHAALGCLASSPYLREAVADGRQVPEEGCALMTNIYDISKAEHGTRNHDAYMDRKRVTKGASHQGQGVRLRL